MASFLHIFFTKRNFIKKTKKTKKKDDFRYGFDTDWTTKEKKVSVTKLILVFCNKKKYEFHRKTPIFALELNS